MSDPFKPAPSVASRFVSQTELSEAQARREADVRAAYARLGQEPPAEALAAARGGGGTEYDPRSLYERLQANKNAKQEKFDEMMKLSNQFRGLDEDETEFLADVAAERRAEEAKKRAEEENELQEFRRATLARASSPPNPLALLTGSALSTSPPAPGSSSAVPLSSRASLSSSIRGSTDGGPAPIAGVKRAADEIDGEASVGSRGSGALEAKRLKDATDSTAVKGSSTAGSSKSASSGGSAALSRKKKAAAALGIVRKKPTQ
ncbi:hypothetical protein OC834_005193 [Tilletia horrida]|nr:hypothetical protein OC834_005193 [Tilletia horrida]KAK0566288.1 hypothetical protein OC844_000823 [Tilletia horrida]